MRVVLGALLALLAAFAVPAGAADGGGEPATHVIVVYRAGADAQLASDRLETAGVVPRHEYRHALQGFAASLSPGQLQAVKRDPAVAFVSADAEIEVFDSAPIAAGEKVPTGTLRIGAATGDTVPMAGKNVAIVDTGLDLSHPDLDAIDGVDCVDAGTTAQDENGHGTLVGGIVGGRNNGAGVVGTAPGTRLYAVRVSDAKGKGSWSQLICGIDWLTANARKLKIKVANLSLGGAGASDGNCGADSGDALHAAICGSVGSGVTYVAAAGNATADLAGVVPAAYPEVLTVTGMADTDGKPGALRWSAPCRARDGDDMYAWFSNYAVAEPDQSHVVAAPGSCILSTKRGGTYAYISGTSAAAPHVTGTVASCIGHGGQRGPCWSMSAGQIVQLIRADADAHATSTNGFVGDPRSPVAGRYYGYLAWAGDY